MIPLAYLIEKASLEYDVPYIENVVVSKTSTIGSIIEPTAALAYSYSSQTSQDNFKLFLAFDFGGILDCSVLSCAGVDCRVLGVKGNSTLCGIDF